MCIALRIIIVFCRSSFQPIVILFLQPSKEDSQAMNEFFTMAEKLIEFDTKVNGVTRSLLGFLRGLAQPLTGNSANWVTYDGALTMEPFSDCVKWIIYDKPYAISHRQVSSLLINV